MTTDEFHAVMDASQRLSDMGNSVAGFAISSSLVLIFACLKDLAAWVAKKAVWFSAGIVVAAGIYISCVWFLHSEETALLALAVIQPAVTHVSDLLAWSRMVGIAVFSIISLLAVWGTSKGAE